MNTKAYTYCLKLLSKRDYSVQKITQKLIAKGLEEAELQEVLENLEKENFLNPNRYLEQRVKSLSKKGFSSDYIQQKLRYEEIEISKEEVALITKNLSIDVHNIIVKLLDKKLSEYINKKSDLTTHQLKSKAMMFLSSKGYDFYQAEDLLPTELSQQE